MDGWGNLEGVRPSKQVHRLLDAGLDYGEARREMSLRHGISDEKFDLLWRIAAVERPVLAESSRPNLFSVYVGIPFCPSRCLYCSFPSHSLKELGRLRKKFVAALLFEIEETAVLVARLGLDAYSVYVGGGTPTSLLPEELEGVLAALRQAFPGQWREFTVEAGRPDTISAEQIKVLAAAGVDRVCINPQTMHKETLRLIGRDHTPAETTLAVAAVRRWLSPARVNMDLIVGLPGENREMVASSAREVVALAPENITVHVFARKRASRFNDEKDSFILPSAEEAVAMHRAATGLLEPVYRPYYLYRQRGIPGGLENVGYSLPGYESAYNIAMIEERHHIIGLGGGANSKLINTDLTLLNLHNPKDVRIYLERFMELAARRAVELAGRVK